MNFFIYNNYIQLKYFSCKTLAIDGTKEYSYYTFNQWHQNRSSRGAIAPSGFIDGALHHTPPPSPPTNYTKDLFNSLQLSSAFSRKKYAKV